MLLIMSVLQPVQTMTPLILILSTEQKYMQANMWLGVTVRNNSLCRSATKWSGSVLQLWQVL